jgi:hypothetical protein
MSTSVGAILRQDRHERRPQEDEIDAILRAGASLQGDADRGWRHVERKTADGHR